jgi:crotonobetaine/carnitine-CoA ligase
MVELTEFLIEELPHFMVPRYIDTLGELPRTPTQKIRKGELREAGVTATTWDRESAGIVARGGRFSRMGRNTE